MGQSECFVRGSEMNQMFEIFSSWFEFEYEFVSSVNNSSFDCIENRNKEKKMKFDAV